MRNDIRELKAWVKKHSPHFTGYTTDDIARLAIACGFTRAAVAEWEQIELRKEATR